MSRDGFNFRNRGAISQRIGIFAAHFAAAKWERETKKWHSCAKGWGYGYENWIFKALGISQSISQLRNEARGCEMALVCQWGVSQLWKFLWRGCIGLGNHFTAKGRFRSQALISLRAYWGYKIISQPRAIFIGASFGLRNFVDHGFFLAFELLLIPRDLPSISLQFLLN